MNYDGLALDEIQRLRQQLAEAHKRLEEMSNGRCVKGNAEVLKYRTEQRDDDGDTKDNAEWMRLRLKEALDSVASGATVSTSCEQMTELM